ncbi:MAG: hypothetical protein R2797_12880 [Gelidibacter sp.]
MKLSSLFGSVCLALLAMNCNVTESIVFNNDMSGIYKTTYDLGPMLSYANDNRPENVEREPKVKMDTIFNIDDMITQYKDSIAMMSPEEQAKLDKLRGMVFEVHQDEPNGISTYTIGKKFKDFDDLMSVGKNLDNATNMIFDYGGTNEMENVGINDYKQETKVTYAYRDNVFERINYKENANSDMNVASKVNEEIESVDNEVIEETVIEDYPIERDDMGYEDEEDNESAGDEMTKQIEAQFEDMFKNAFYTIQYTFPRRIKSVSSDMAVISADGKSLTLKVDWDTIHDDDSILNLKVELEN